MGISNSTNRAYNRKCKERNAEFKKMAPYARAYGFYSQEQLRRKINAGANGYGGDGRKYGSDLALSQMRRDAKYGALGRGGTTSISYCITHY